MQGDWQLLSAPKLYFKISKYFNEDTYNHDPTPNRIILALNVSIGNDAIEF